MSRASLRLAVCYHRLPHCLSRDRERRSGGEIPKSVSLFLLAGSCSCSDWSCGWNGVPDPCPTAICRILLASSMTALKDSLEHYL